MCLYNPRPYLFLPFLPLIVLVDCSIAGGYDINGTFGQGWEILGRYEKCRLNEMGLLRPGLEKMLASPEPHFAAPSDLIIFGCPLAVPC